MFRLIGLALVVSLALVAPAWAAGSNVLTWGNPSPDSATTVDVHRKAEPCAGVLLSFTRLASLPAPAATYVDAAVTENATYCYVVFGVNVDGTSPPSNTAERRVPFTVPAARSGLGVVGGP